MFSESFVNKITRLVDNRKNSIIEFLQALVRIPSVVGKEKDCTLFCAKKLEKMGFQIDLWEPDIKDLKNHPAYNSSSETNYENRPNLVGVLKGTGEGRSILLNGHIDVVPPGPLDIWEHDPWSGTIKDSAKSISRQDIKLIFVNAGADQWLLNLYGGTPTVQFGPGGGNAHSPDEFIYISELINSTKILALTLMEWCGVK